MIRGSFHHEALAASAKPGEDSRLESAEVAPLSPESRRRDALLLFLASFLAIYFELALIRYLSAEIRAFAYLKNLPLIASFLGLGLGMALGRAPGGLKRAFPMIAAALILLIADASLLNLTHIPLPSADYFVWGSFPSVDFLLPLKALRYFGIVLAIIALVVAFFVVLGGIVGEYLSRLCSLSGYGINLAGSVAGITAFALLAFAAQPPVIWMLIGFVAALPFFLRERLAIVIFVLILFSIGLPEPNTVWSPYYRVSLEWLATGSDWPHPSAYSLTVDRDFHQKIVDLSQEFTARHPGREPNRSMLPIYELPYRLIEHPGEVLIVGRNAR